MNEVAKKLDITATEACRQLQRLTDAGLLEKTPEGRYRSTPYSKVILESATAMNFLSKHREYFLSHDTSFIPPEFRARFGELSKAVLHTQTVPNLNTGNEVLKSAEQRIDVMGEQRLEQHSQIAKQRSSEGVKVRTLLHESNIENMKEELALAKQSVERRFIPRVCAVMIMTEKIMGFALPGFDGKYDYQVLTGNDPESIRWARDLFEDQWNKARSWHP